MHNEKLVELVALIVISLKQTNQSCYEQPLPDRLPLLVGTEFNL